MGWQQNLTNMWATIRNRPRHTMDIENDISKSSEDRRTYRGLTLSNNMRLLLISDPSTDKAAAALDVHVGHLTDPDEVPGLAHLCEHMLFMGTKKSKEVDEYKQFLSEHGGSSNAYTSMEHTNYHFEIAAGQLEEALKRFSMFIRQPQFDRHVIEREINVVNAENEKNMSNDQCRLFQLTKSTADPGHPYSKFGTGNIDTLLINPRSRGLSVYKKLVNYHRRFYSANIMCLVVMGRESLDELEAFIVPLFKDVRNNSIDLPKCQRNPYGSDQLKVRLSVVPLKNMENMLLTWPIHDIMPLYKIKPGHYLGYVMSFQGPGSLYAELKGRGWINQLVAANKLGGRGFMFFCVSMDLTEKGFNHTDAIISLVFQYIRMLKETGVTERMYQECSALKSLRFRFKEKEAPRDYVSDYAELLHSFSFRDVLTGPWLMTQYNEKEIHSLLEKINPENIRIVIQSKRFSGETDLIEKWYGTEYSLHPLPDKTVKEWHQLPENSTFHLPAVNEFIPTNLELVCRDEKNPRLPELLEESALARLWYRQDDRYLLPKTSVTIQLTSLCAYQDAECVAKEEMALEQLIDHLQPLCQPAEWAGLFCDIFSTPSGITLALHGYSDKLDVLLIRAMRSLATFQIDPNRYMPTKEKYLKSLSNFEMEQPHKQATQLVTCVTSERSWTKMEILKAAQETSPNAVQEYLMNFMSELHVEMLVYGNVTRQTASSYLQIVSDILLKEAHTKPLCSASHYTLRELQLPKDVTLYKHLSVALRPTCAVAMYFQCGRQSTRVNVLLELFFHLSHQHCYDVLRTREQLGYIVLYSLRRSKGVHGLRIVAQSHYPTSYIHLKIMEFTEALGIYLSSISEEKFINQRVVLKNQRLEKVKRMGEQNARYWTEISSNLYQFDRGPCLYNFTLDANEAKELSTVQKEDVIQFYQDYIKPGGQHRRALAVHVVPESCKATGDGTQMTEIGCLDSFKSSVRAYPAPQPEVWIPNRTHHNTETQEEEARQSDVHTT